MQRLRTTSPSLINFEKHQKKPKKKHLQMMKLQQQQNQLLCWKFAIGSERSIGWRTLDRSKRAPKSYHVSFGVYHWFRTGGNVNAGHYDHSQCLPAPISVAQESSAYIGGTGIEVQMSDQNAFRCMFKT